MKNVTSDPLEDLVIVAVYIFVVFFGLSLLPLFCQDENKVVDAPGHTIE